ncbi:MAG: high-affinity nickel-transport family protein [Gemmatimonadales bacterium]
MTALPTVLALGFFLGMRHATDPDHVIAVATIVARQRNPGAAAMIGAAWGLGHTLTILIVGGGIILFGWVIPGRMGLSLELAVGAMLIVLGLANLGDLFQLVRRPAQTAKSAHVHSHAHSHGDYVHTHPHGHEPEAHPHAPDRTPVSWLDRHLGTIGSYRLLRPMIVGVVHGLAGSAAVALLVLAAIGDPSWSLFYLLLFGVGTIAGMMIVTAAIAMPFRYADHRSGLFARRLRAAAGLVSVAVGCFLAYRIGFVQGLFTGSPQ